MGIIKRSVSYSNFLFLFRRIFKINFKNMKFSAAVIALSQAASVTDLNRKVVSAQTEIAKGARADGNALLIQQLLEFYLDREGHNPGRAAQMLNYGCYCQLLET